MCASAGTNTNTIGSSTGVAHISSKSPGASGHNPRRSFYLRYSPTKQAERRHVSLYDALWKEFGMRPFLVFETVIRTFAVYSD